MSKSITKKVASYLILISIILGGFSIAQNSEAAINKQFNYQGKLTDANGVAVADGIYDITFNLYDDLSDTSADWTETWDTTLWTETAVWTSVQAGVPSAELSRIIYVTGTNEATLKAGQTLWNTTRKESALIYAVDAGNNYIDIQTPSSVWATTDDLTNRVYVRNGLFSVMVGSVTDQAIEFTSADYYLGIAVGADNEMKPRKIIGAVPFAWNANSVVGDGRISLDYNSDSITALSVTQSGTGDIVNLAGDAITTGTGFAMSVDGLTSGMGMDITSTSIAGTGSGNTKLLNLSRSGTNTNASHTAYGLYSAVTNTGTTSTNIGGYFSASGATNNYGLIVENGNVGIGDTTPTYKLTVDGDIGITSGNDLYIGDIGLNDVGTSSVTSGASVIGVYDEFDASDSTNVQDVLDDLDADIASVSYRAKYDRVVAADGTGTDTTIAGAISNATTGDTIFITAGTYNENITIDKSLELIGAGRAATTITGATGSPTITVNSAINDVTISTMKITNAGSAATDDVISVPSGTTRYRHYYRNLEISGGDDGIYMDDLYESEIVNSYIHDTGDDGITYITCYDISVSNNIIKNAGGTAIDASMNAFRTRILGNYMFNSGDVGIYLWGAHNATVSDNIIYETGSQGIYNNQSNYVAITGNTIKNAGDAINEYGIYIYATTNTATISNNTIQDAFDDGIKLNNTNGVAIIGNTIYSSGGNGINSTGINIFCTTITGNTLNSNTEYGVKVGDVWDATNSIIANNTFYNNTSGSIDTPDLADNILIGPNITQGDVDIMNLLYYSATGNTFSNDLIELVLDGADADSFTGNALRFIVDQSQNTGNLILAEDDDSNMLFRLDENGGLYAEGDVSIGTDTPTAKLTVTQSGSGDIVNIFDGATEVFTILNGGNIGIGVIDPDTKLEILNAGDQLKLSFDGTDNATFAVDTDGHLTITPSGGNIIVSEINDIIYVDGTKYAQDGKGIQEAINDLPATGGKVILPEGTYNIGENTQVESCDTTNVWTGSASVNATADDIDYEEGDASAKLEILDGFTTGLVAYHNFASDDLSNYSNIKLKIKSSSAKAHGVFQLVLDNDNDCASPIRTIDLPANSTGWVDYYLNLSGSADLTGITCIGIIAASDPGIVTIRLDDIRAAKGPVMIDKDYVTLEGVGHSSKLYLANSSNMPVILSGDGTNTISNIKISDLKIDGNDANNTGTCHGIYFNTVTYSEIGGVWVYDAEDYGVYLYNNSDNNIVSNNNISSVVSRGIYLYYADNNIVSNNNISSITGFGVYNRYSNNNFISGNDISSCQVGIRLYANCDRNRIIGNSVHNNDEEGIVLANSAAENIISNNLVYSNDKHGIVLGENLDHNNIISNNNIYNNGGSDTYHGIYVISNSDNNIISSNRITDIGGDGYAIYIASSNADNTILVGNYYSGTGATAINDLGTGTKYTQENRLTIEANDTDYGEAVTALTVTQSGIGNIIDLKYSSTSLFTLINEDRLKLEGNLATSIGNFNDNLIDDMEVITDWTASSANTPVASETTKVKVNDAAMKITTGGSSTTSDYVRIDAYSPVEDWSSIDRIGFWIQSDETGQIISIQLNDDDLNDDDIHDDDVVSDHNITIQATNEWQYEEWDISGIADASRNDVEWAQFIIDSVTDTPVFYIDQLRRYNNSSATNRMAEYFLDADGKLVIMGDQGVEIWRTASGSSLPAMEFGAATVAIKNPLDLQVEGDVGIEYNLEFLNNGISYLNSAGPLTISAGDSNSYENLTLTTSGTGDVIMDIADSALGFKIIGTTTSVFAIDASGNVTIGGVNATDSDLVVKRNISTQGGNLTLSQLSMPANVVVTALTSDSTAYDYRVSAINGNGETIASATVSIANGAATPNNRVTWDAVSGATGYKIYGRTTTELYMATVNSPTLYYDDDNTDTPSGALPSANTTGGKLAINTTSPSRRLEVLENTSAIPQMKIISDGSNFAEFYADSTGDLSVGLSGSGGDDIIILDENLKICAGGSFGSVSCPSVTGQSGTGDLIVENEAYFSGDKVIYPNDTGFTRPKRTIILTAAGAITPTSNGAAQTKTDGTNFTYYTLDFDQTTDESAYWEFTVPDSFDAATDCTVTVFWTASAGTATNGVSWKINTLGRTDDEVLDSALGTELEIEDAMIATGDIMVSSEGTLVDDWAVGEYAVVKVYRDADAYSGTNLAADAKLLKIKIEYSVTKESD